MVDTISESLNSILENIPIDYELVIVDESHDGSREIINSISTDNPIQKIFISNIGLSASRNLAVEKATGDIVLTHIDMDDWYDSRYFEPLVELYIKIKQNNGGRDFWFSCPNFNITSRKSYLNRYKLRDLPIGAGEREYRWRVLMTGDYIGIDINENISERIKKSDRKDILSRVARTFNLIVGLFQIGYSFERVLREEVLTDARPYHSSLFVLVVVPFAYIVSNFRRSLNSDVPEEKEPLDSWISRNTYQLEELQQKYNIDPDMDINSLVTSGQPRYD
jgi:glycosyltransferase involved in cell wall biosynthesis